MVRDLAVALLALVACRGGGDSSKHEGPAALASAAFYRLDAAAQPPCAARAPCEARVVLTALGDYHVNQQYPQKFVADAVAGVAVDGSGTFSIDRDRPATGTLAIRFRADRAGDYVLRGTFKLGVCNEDDCQIETPTIAIPVAAR